MNSPSRLDDDDATGHLGDSRAAFLHVYAPLVGDVAYLVGVC